MSDRQSSLSVLCSVGMQSCRQLSECLDICVLPCMQPFSARTVLRSIWKELPKQVSPFDEYLVGDMSFKRPSGKPVKGSLESTTSSSGTNAHSQRSSFAMERASLDAKRSSVEMFTNMPPQQRRSVEAGYQNLEAACRQMGIPKSMCERCLFIGNSLCQATNTHNGAD